MSLPTTPNGTTLGYRIDLERRAELHRSASRFNISKVFAAPEEIDPRAKLRTEDQRQMGSCAGQSQSSCGELLNLFGNGGSIQLSAMYSYLAGQTMDGLLGQDNGATITGTVRGAKEMGYCLEETFPYPGQYTSRFPAGSKEEGANHRLRRHVMLSSYQQCFDWLASGVGAIQIGIAWTAELADNTSGVISAARGQNYGGHALAVLGYSKRVDSKGRKHLWMLNSHGRQWGRDGWAEVAPGMMDQWCRDRNSEVVGVTDLQVFTPRRVSFVGMSG
jgi:hypothetical protein